MQSRAETLTNLWQRAKRPNIVTFLTGAGDVGTAELLQLLQLDQKERWQHGERTPAEWYLEQFPRISERIELAVDLIYHEYLVREELGETLDPAEFARRFPEHAEQLARQFEVHAALALVSAQQSALPEATVASSAPSASPAASWPAPEGYEVLGELGRGGMGVVYRARQVELNRLVALKMILSDAQASPEELARFRAEAEAAARLRHPNIGQMYATGTYQGRPFFSMELVEGGNLAERLAGQPRPPAEVALFAFGLAGAVHHAHLQGIVHRDLKPANVLMQAKADASFAPPSPPELRLSDFEPKITDFGLAKRLHDDTARTATGAILGTPRYMAPEQAAGQNVKVGPATDIFALGVILYEMLTGRPPFLAASTLDTLDQICRLEPVPLRSLQPGLSRDLETICLKCLRKEPRERYASAAALADDLQRYLDGRPILARPVTLVERAWRWCKRHPAVASLSAAFLCTLVAGVVASSLFAVRAQRARNLAEDRYEIAQEAVDTYLNQVLADPDLQATPDVRERLLEKAVPFYLKLVETQPQDVVQEVKRGQAFYRLGRIRQELGKLQEAMAHFDQMREVFASLQNRYPHEPEYDLELGRSYLGQGIALFGLKEFDRAEGMLGEARTIGRRLAKDHPQALAHDELLARAHQAIANVYSNLNRREDALDTSADAARIWLRLCAARPDDMEWLSELDNCQIFRGEWVSYMDRFTDAEDIFKSLLHRHAGYSETVKRDRRTRSSEAKALGCLASLYDTQKRYDKAKEHVAEAFRILKQLVEDYSRDRSYGEALAITAHNHAVICVSLKDPPGALDALETAVHNYTKLVRRYPSLPFYKNGLAMTYNTRSNLLRDEGRLDEAVAACTSGIALLEPVLAGDQRLVEFRRTLCLCYFNRAWARELLGQHADEVKDYDRVLALNVEPKKQADYRRWRAIALARAGRVSEALSVAEEELSASFLSAEGYYELAKIHAIAWAAKKDGDRAARTVAHLQKAREGGYFADSRKVEELKKSPEFRAMNGTEEMRQFLNAFQK